MGWLLLALMIGMIIAHMAVTTTTTLAEFIQEEMDRCLLEVRETAMFWPGGPAHRILRFKDRTAKARNSIDFNKYSQLTAHDVVEGEDYTDVQSLDPTSTNVGTGEKQIITWLSDKSAREIESPNDLRARAADEAEEHLLGHIEKFDTAIYALFTGLTQGHSGTGAALTNAHVKAAVKVAREQKMPKPWVGFLHVEQYGDLAAEASSPFLAISESGANLAGDMYENFELRRAYGVTWFISMDVYDDATDVWGGILSGRTIGAIMNVLPGTPTTEYDQSRRSTEISTVADWGVGVADATMGVYIQSDAP